LGSEGIKQKREKYARPPPVPFFQNVVVTPVSRAERQENATRNLDLEPFGPTMLCNTPSNSKDIGQTFNQNSVQPSRLARNLYRRYKISGWWSVVVVSGRGVDQRVK
jgi:hypothetical protein